MTRKSETIPRRHVLELGAASIALLILPEACSSSSHGGAGDASTDGTPKDVTAPTQEAAAAPPCKTELPDAGPSCPQSDQTTAVNIMDAGVDQPGTSYVFTACRYLDPACNDDRILLIHLKKSQGYVALQGACPNECCDQTMGGGGGPTYYSACPLTDDSSLLGGFSCGVDAGAADAGFDAGLDASSDAALDATLDAGLDASSDAGLDASSDAALDAGFDAGLDAGFDAGFDAGNNADAALAGGQVLADIVLCTCCGSIFDATSGAVINGPSKFGLQKLDTCEANGWVIITTPKAS